MASDIALEYKIPTSTLFSLVKSESNWNPTATSSTGDCGLTQINTYYSGVPCETAFNPDFALRYAALAISKHQEYLWSSCSCVSTARNLGIIIPNGYNADDFVPNITLADVQIGDLVLFKYKNGIYHIAVVIGFQDGKLLVKEGNFKACVAPSTRLVDPSDPNIRGYWRDTILAH